MATILQEQQQFQLARRLYRTVFDHTESFEDEDQIGADLSYLLGAILFTGSCEWPADRPIVVLLRQHFPPEDPLWQHITLEPPEPEATPEASEPAGSPASPESE